MNRIFSFLGLCLAFVCGCLTGRASAAPPVRTEVHTVAIGPTFFESRTFDVPQFDAAQGQLLSVDVAGHVHDATYYGLEFLCTSGTGQSSTTWTNDNYTTLLHGGVTDAAGSGGESLVQTADSTFDGVLDASGTSGTSTQSSYDYDLVVAPSISGAQMRPFVGQGTVPVQLDLHKTSFYWGSTGPCGQLGQFAVATSDLYSYELTITYVFR